MPQNQKAFKLIAVKNREYDRLRQLGRVAKLLWQLQLAPIIQAALVSNRTR